MTNIENTIASTSNVNLLNNYWVPVYSVTCPKCGKQHIEYNPTMCLTTYPAQYSCRCLDCQETFTMSERELKLYPGNWTYERKGWICPKCGRAISPEYNCCPYCDGPMNRENIVYCNGNTVESVTNMDTLKQELSFTTVCGDTSNALS